MTLYCFLKDILQRKNFHYMNGLSLAEINVLLVKKIEELTLYIIELNKRIEKLEKHEK